MYIGHVIGGSFGLVFIIFNAIGVAMIVLGIVGLAIAFIAHDRDLVAVISGVGSGIVLLASPLFPALRVVTRARRRG